MARRHRFHSPNSTYHVMLRGNNGHDIFFSDDDRYRMCLLLQQSAERFGQKIEAYCFMTNHIHLAMRVSETSLSKFMHYLAFRYVRYINRKYKRIGHLFQGRFHSVLIDDTEYLKELIIIGATPDILTFTTFQMSGEVLIILHTYPGVRQVANYESC